MVSLQAELLATLLAGSSGLLWLGIRHFRKQSSAITEPCNQQPTNVTPITLHESSMPTNKKRGGVRGSATPHTSASALNAPST
jgi:hypothetical protein